jgi:phage terminase large subunit-like protein
MTTTSSASPEPSPSVARTERPAWVEAAVDAGFGFVGFEWEKAAAVEGAWFDEALADRIVAAWPRWFVFTVGRWGGQPFRLVLWQECAVRLLVGWKLADGTRLYRVLWLWIARKNGKTEFLAALGLLFWLIDGEFGGEAYAFASSEDQARIVFEKMTRMVQLSPVLKGKVTTLSGSLFCPELLAKIVPLSGKASGKHGLNASVLIGDEVHEWRDGDLHTTLSDSMSGRDQPIQLLASTAGLKGNYGEEVFADCVRKASTSPASDELVVIFAADPDDDPSLEETWRKASPNLGVSPTLRFLTTRWEKARDNPRLQADFRRYYLNQWTGVAAFWIPLDRWDAGAPDKTRWQRIEEEMRGRRCWAGLDLSSTSDLTAFVLLFEPIEGETAWVVLPRLWVPGDNVEKRARDDRVAYDRWAASGAIRPTAGNTVDYSEIRRQVIADGEVYDIQGLAVDRAFQGHETGVLLAEHGLPVVAMGQGFWSMSQPSKDFEVLALSGQIDAGGHPVMRWAVENVRYAQDDAGNIKPSKSKSSGKIDPVVALIMAVGLAKRGEAASGEDDYFASLKEAGATS